MLTIVDPMFPKGTIIWLALMMEDITGVRSVELSRKKTLLIARSETVRFKKHGVKIHNNKYFLRNRKEATMKFNPDPVIKSAFRISKLTKLLQQNQDPDVFEAIRKESGILAQRAVALWLTLNFEE